MNETTRRSEWNGGNITTAYGGALDPGPARHYHRIPGVWDDDNGPIAGNVCGACWDANYRINLAAVKAAQ